MRTPELQNVISLIVEEGIVAEFAQTVSDLDEVIVRNGQEILSHTINYGSETYKYEDVVQFIMVYLRNDAFSAEYQKEIADSFPDYSTVSDSGVVSIVGLSGLNKVILRVAGAGFCKETIRGLTPFMTPFMHTAHRFSART